MSPLYETSARAVGGREGHVETADGLFKADLAMPKALGGSGNGANPEQLFAAGYAACFESAVRHVARQQKLGLKDAAVTATVQLFPKDGGGFRLGVALAAEIEGLEEAAARELVETAHQVCPYSNAVRGNIDVQLTTTVR
ncbi:organic hydroperoxide resistance protein [Phenylobacterium sp.]|jgi:Ohr subfamily peroxiredoxin|uniref:organic hydroperoxide resistance protein n=1 Tax=Phenylobacterium sp. TaxID=1871053 RepID=UPI000C8DDE03|nr:organic hydroperoxide resistance protein [Phenylobacterium sp.]MAK83482.1 organic hydroperoxide resistance protein [Phenylobacterium sp.]|tara:strand:+ start:15672 stop:16091 length:420 start_codon:yes stop_codon:yes gene_type:complete